MRKASIKRKTKETDIEVAVNLDGSGVSEVATGIGFFDHMLDLLARHSRFDITVKAIGDLHVRAQLGALGVAGDVRLVLRRVLLVVLVVVRLGGDHHFLTADHCGDSQWVTATVV